MCVTSTVRVVVRHVRVRARELCLPKMCVRVCVSTALAVLVRWCGAVVAGRIVWPQF